MKVPESPLEVCSLGCTGCVGDVSRALLRQMFVHDPQVGPVSLLKLAKHRRLGARARTPKVREGDHRNQGVGGAKRWSKCPACRGKGKFECGGCKGKRVMTSLVIKPSLKEAELD